MRRTVHITILSEADFGKYIEITDKYMIDLGDNTENTLYTHLPIRIEREKESGGGRSGEKEEVRKIEIYIF